jgi:SAM-dependent methyltransferase
MGVAEASEALGLRIGKAIWNNHQYYLGRGPNRITAVQRALEGRAAPVYVEIGVEYGFAFRKIAADHKIAVDPALRLSARSLKTANAKARVTHYFGLTSDAFFENETAFLEQHGIDVALIDGLHTYKQALRDVENIVRYLRHDGVIVMHDCSPPMASIGTPATSYEEYVAHNPPNHWRDYFWTGDVWKAIVHLRSTRDDLRIAVLNADFGVGMVRKGPADSQLSYSAAQVDALTYADLVDDRERLLNLKPAAYLDEFLASARRIPPNS